MLSWKQHFFTSTRGRIILLLRRNSHTVDELAVELGLTDNAVRAHLLTLERDGLVRPSGTRRRGGKPATLYDLTAEAEQLFPHAYASVLRAVLEVLSEGMPTEQRAVIMQQVGRSLAKQWHLPPDDLRDRLPGAVALLNDLGGLAELEEDEEQFTIQGYHCPFAVLVPTHPEVCKIAQTLLTELLGVPVVERCEQHEPARCCFTVIKA